MSTVDTTPAVTPSNKIPKSITILARAKDRKPKGVKAPAKKAKKPKDPNKLTPNQIRVLQALKRRKHSISRADLKDLVGIGRDKKYSGGWLTELWSLNERRLIRITESSSDPDVTEGGHPKHMHSITAKGIKALGK